MTSILRHLETVTPRLLLTIPCVRAYTNLIDTARKAMFGPVMSRSQQTMHEFITNCRTAADQV